MGMGVLSVESVWDDLASMQGDDLRAVARYDRTSYETKLRADIRDQYSEHADRSIVDDAILNQMILKDNRPGLKAGELESVVRVYEDIWFIVWPDGTSRKSGFIVSIQRGGQATMADVASVLEYLEEEVAPALDPEP